MIKNESDCVEQALEILYRDNNFIAINKPHGLIVHPTPMARDATESALFTLKEQVGQYLYTAHRIDRKTSGVLVFALTKEALQQIRYQFDNHLIHKRYVAIVRGHFQSDELVLDYPLINENGVEQDAVTTFRLLGQSEIPISSGRYDSSRYSIIECLPITGRFHQIRKHLAHLRHPIIGDRPHGCNKQNRFFKAQWNMTKMLLHARELSFEIGEEQYHFEASFSDVYVGIAEELGLSAYLK
jgi:tRNA pseudouridine65 synthase